MTNLRKAAEDLLEGVEAAIKAGDWKVDGACDPDLAIVRLRQALAQPEQEPVDKTGSPCPEFWDWLPKAYNFDSDGSFTKYNMEVAFLAGQQSVTQQPPIAFMGTDFEGNPTKFRLNHFSGSLPLYTAPPKRERSEPREWVGLTDAERKACWHDSLGFYRTIETASKEMERLLKEKNT